MASQYKRSPAPPRPARRTPPAAALHPYDGQAALLLDSVGTILAVTGTAAGLLNRPERELTGRSFGVLPPELSVQLDLTGTPGGRKVVTARAVSSDPRAVHRGPCVCSVAIAGVGLEPTASGL